jgi:hypothetical protein
VSKYAERARPATDLEKEAIEEIRALLSDGHASYGDMYQLQVFADEGVIDPDDIDMLEAAGVSEWEATGYGEGNPDEFDDDLVAQGDALRE